MNKINILKTYFLEPNINYKHEIKIQYNYCELFIYENNNNYYTLYFYVSNTTYYSYFKVKQIKPNYNICYGINVNGKRINKIKNYNYISPINILKYFKSYNYDLEFIYDPDLKIKKIDNNIFIKFNKNILKLRRGLKIYDAFEHCFYNHKYNVRKSYLTYYINYYIYIYNYKEYNFKLYNRLYNTIFCNYSRHFMIII